MNEGIEITKLDTPWTTESGYTFSSVDIAWKSWGTLNKEKNNVVLICHALTGHAAADEWFGGLFVEDGFLDTDSQFILSINVPGSCYGSTGPTSVNPETGKTYRGDFPGITIRDIVTFEQLLLDHLGITGIEIVIGGSMGGMTALEFLIMDERVQSAALLAMGKDHSPWAIGISQAQRKAIYADPNWKEGFYDEEHPPKAGLAAAREMAMITYRSPENYASKFGREIQPGKDAFQVESYLDYQGEKLVNRFDANSYVLLSKAMDTHDIARDRDSAKEVLGKVQKPVLIVGIESDLLYPIYEQEELAGYLPDSTLAKIQSPYGHDAFLIEFEQINRHLKKFYHSLTQTYSSKL